MNINNLQYLLIDGDGVLWNDNEAIPGLSRFINSLNDSGIRWTLVTNNSTRTVEQYVQKLANFNVEISPKSIFTSATVTAEILRKRYPQGSPVYVIGETGIKTYMAQAGFEVLTGESQPDHVEAVIVGMDREISYNKLTVATRAILKGADFIATNPDRSFPTPHGLALGTGSLIAALTATTDIHPEVIGKPQPTIFQSALDYLHADPAHSAMLGDRLETDILGGQNVGINTIAVLSGITSTQQIQSSDIKPDRIFDDISALADALNTR